MVDFGCSSLAASISSIVCDILAAGTALKRVEKCLKEVRVAWRFFPGKPGVQGMGIAKSRIYVTEISRDCISLKSIKEHLNAHHGNSRFKQLKIKGISSNRGCIGSILKDGGTWISMKKMMLLKGVYVHSI